MQRLATTLPPPPPLSHCTRDNTCPLASHDERRVWRCACCRKLCCSCQGTHSGNELLDALCDECWAEEVRVNGHLHNKEQP